MQPSDPPIRKREMEPSKPAVPGGTGGSAVRPLRAMYNAPMRTWALGGTDPRALRLAADALAGPTDYANDQIWELQLGGGRPPALALETTYGRRARSLRLYAGFAVDGPTLVDPLQFVMAPKVTAFLPSWLRVQFIPFEGLEVQAEFWVPDSHAVAGRYCLTNTSLAFRGVRLILYAVLDPAADGRPMAPETRGGAVILSGRTAALSPVVFMTGGASPEAGSIPGLALTVDVAPHASRGVVWACAAGPTVEESFQAARSVAARSWDAEVSRLERIHGRWVDVETGDPEWDAVLALGQKSALGSFIGATGQMPHPSVILSRTPDRGYSQAGDGTDYDSEWSGADVKTAEFAASQVLYAAPELAEGIVENYLSTQLPDGTVDGKPGAGGQRARWSCPPRLAGLAWKIFTHTGNEEFLRVAFPSLMKFFERWSAADLDPGGLGLPIWEHTLQAGADARPVFASGSSWGEGIDLRCVVSPDLLAALAGEAEALIRMADLLGEATARHDLQRRKDALQQAVAACWSPGSATFHYLDRDTRQTSSGRPLGEGMGPNRLRLRQVLDPPGRISVWVEAPEMRARRIRVYLEGKVVRGRPRIEQLTARRFRWLWDRGVTTSEGVFARLDVVRIEGIAPDVRVVLRGAGLDRQDLNLLLPLGSGDTSPDVIADVVGSALMNPERYGRPYGWPSVPADDPFYAPGAPGGPWVVDLPLQTLIGEALVQAGYRSEAYAALEKILRSLVEVLRTDGAFWEAYHPETGEGWGKRDHVAGVAPLSLFLEVAGVRLLSPYRVEVSGPHVFPRPVTIRWRGLLVERRTEGTRIVFPDDSETFVDPGAEATVERVAEGG